MLDPGDILDPTMTEAKRVLDEMRTTEDLDKRATQSEILLNLCQSAGVFFDLMADAISADGFPDPDNADLFGQED